jgi:cell wall-associated NlpC family hydrolase
LSWRTRAFPQYPVHRHVAEVERLARGADHLTMLLARKLVPSLLVLVLGAALPSLATAAPTLAGWDVHQQRQVTRAGLMHEIGHSFAGARALSAAQAGAAVAALAAKLPATVTPAADPPAPPSTAGPVTVAGLDAMLVRALGLGPVAAHVQSEAAAAGLTPPPYFGTEVVARYLGLRYDHPAGTDDLELFPTDPVTRAEAAWSLAAVLNLPSWSVPGAQQTLSAFTLPRLTPSQRTALRIAVSRIGYPYVWGGTTDDTSDGLAHGGFDCSGLAWRVYKVSGLPWGQSIHGRTAAQQAGEIPRRRRLRMAQLRPGDLLFFGSAHFAGRATEASVYHEGIYLGDNWVIHSSGQGVYVLPLKGSWLGDSFAWGRRVIG